ncbi:MAG: DUF1801 domain-containing protein [Defluviitaleaceae bacterium]|nr:DUF1801 domain-containing protein [Defluviitaleaceae bacterium]
MSDVESYISQFPSWVRERLAAMRNIGLEVFGGTTERIYHGVPTFMVADPDGRDIFSYGAYKSHITLYIGYIAVQLENGLCF